MRDVLNKIAKWVEKFIEVGDLATQYDPVRAALPWASLSFILKVSLHCERERRPLRDLPQWPKYDQCSDRWAS